jgi:hypothetical protein
MIQRIFAIILKISNTQAMLVGSFGIVGGGGRSGSLIFGRVGRSGRSGKAGRCGRIGRFGRLICTVGTSGNERRGRFGSTIGTKLKWYSGRRRRSPARIL